MRGTAPKVAAPRCARGAQVAPRARLPLHAVQGHARLALHAYEGARGADASYRRRSLETLAFPAAFNVSRTCAVVPAHRICHAWRMLSRCAADGSRSGARLQEPR